MMLDLAMVAVSATVALAIGGVYYGVMGEAIGSSAPSRPGWQVAVVEVARCLVLALVVAIVANGMDVDTWLGGLALGAVLWLGFPVVLLGGAVFHEGAPVRSSVVHAGDWLLKLLAIGLIVALMS